MSVYVVSIKRSALRALQDIPQVVRARLLLAIEELATDPRPYGSTRMQGEEGYRIRAGDYRAVYVVDDGARTVSVRRVGHRREVYRG